jgi:hypothetical protein
MSDNSSAKIVRKKRSNHFLPVCYQKAFTDAEGLVWAQFLDKDPPPLHLAPKSVGAIYKYYTRLIHGMEDDSLESAFGTLVESGYAPLAQRMRSEKDQFRLRKEDVPILLKFVAAQVVRTEAHRRCISKQAGYIVSSEVFVHNIGRKIRKIVEAWDAKAPDVLLRTSLPYIGSHFITGDSPAITFRGPSQSAIEQPVDTMAVFDIDNLLADPDSGFILPVSPYVCLTVRNGGAGRMLVSPRREPPEFVAKTNEVMYGQCIQFIEAADARSLAFHRRS